MTCIYTKNINFSKKGLIWQIIISHAHEFFDQVIQENNAENKLCCLIYF